MSNEEAIKILGDMLNAEHSRMMYAKSTGLVQCEHNRALKVTALKKGMIALGANDEQQTEIKEV